MYIQCNAFFKPRFAFEPKNVQSEKFKRLVHNILNTVYEM